MGERIRSLNPSALINLWVAYVYSGDVEAALRVLNQQITVDPRRSIAHLNLGFMNARRGEMDKAARAFRLVEQLSPLGPSGTANLAHAYAQIGQPEDARRLFETVERMSGEQRISAGTWAMAYLAIGANDQALRWLDKAIEKIENHEPDTGWHSMMIIKANVTADPVLDEPRFTERRDKIQGN
jgi:Flp pilus assembly protein TadD